MSSTVKPSVTPDQSGSVASTNHTGAESRYRLFCHAGRLICLLATIGLSIGVIGCFIMSVFDFVAVVPPSGDSRPTDLFLSDGSVGDSKCKSYVAFGENYNWPIPQLHINHHAYSTITGVDEASRSRTWKKTSQTSIGVAAWQRPGIADHRTTNPSVALGLDSNEALPEFFYPGLSHAPCAAKTAVTSRPLVALDTVFKLSWYALCLFVVVQMYRLFTHCLSGSILDGAALGICKKILICYTTMLLFGPFSLYIFNLIASSGVAHIVSIPYTGIVFWLVFTSMYTLMRNASYLKSEVEATI